MTGQTADRVEKPARKRQQRSLRTQQRLLDAAVEAFSESGFKATSTRNIAQRAGVHHPLIAYHFRSKDELWRAAVDRIFGELQQRLAEAEALSAGESLKTRLTAMIHAYAAYGAQQPALHRMLLFEAGRPGPRLDWLAHKYLRPFVTTTVADLRELQRQGVAAHGNPALLLGMIRLLAGGLPALLYEMKLSSNVDVYSARGINAMAELIVDVFLPGDSPDLVARERSRESLLKDRDPPLGRP